MEKLCDLRQGISLSMSEVLSVLIYRIGILPPASRTGPGTVVPAIITVTIVILLLKYSCEGTALEDPPPGATPQYGP